MNLYFAPLEGITNLIYRNLHSSSFGGCDTYFAPFISPSDQDKINKKGIRDILPELNEGVILKAQVLTNDSGAFLRFADKIKAIGYDEVNLNMGCPAGTVVKKGRGAGFLKEPEKIDNFLYKIFSANKIKISIKTRIGYRNEEEMYHLLEIYNKYPLTKLIVHPRTGVDMYNGTPRMNIFDMVYKASKNKVCYNGNINTKADYEKIIKTYPDLEGVMIGRGGLINPALFREIKGGNSLTRKELMGFSDALMNIYSEGLRSEVYTLHKMKEIWHYMIQNFPEEKKIAKAVKKARTINDFTAAIEKLPEITK